jgi:hypothetical protein
MNESDEFLAWQASFQKMVDGMFSRLPLLKRKSMLDVIKKKHTEYDLFMGNGRPDWLVGNEDKLSDSAWLALVAVPWLLQELESYRNKDGKDRDSNG